MRNGGLFPQGGSCTCQLNFRGDDPPSHHTKPWDQYRKNIAQLQSLSQISFYFCFVINIIVLHPPPHVVDIDESTYYTHHQITRSLVCRENQSPFTLVAQRHHGTQNNCGIPNTTEWHHQGIRAQNCKWDPCKQTATANYLVCVCLLPWTVTTIFTWGKPLMVFDFHCILGSSKNSGQVQQNVSKK